MADTVNPIFADEAASRAYLEKLRWPNGPVCVHCGAYGTMVAPVQNTGKTTKEKPKGKKRRPAREGLYYCNSCKGTFTVTVGSVMEDSHVPLNKWLYAFFLMCSSKKGVSSHQLHRTLGVTYKTAWFMSHRIREAMRSGSLAPPMLGGGGGVVEVDETVYGRTSSHPKGRTQFPSSQHKNIIVALVERGGEVRSYHVEGSTVSQVIPIVNANVAREAQIMTDASQLYKYRLGTYASHDRVDHSKDEYVRKEPDRPLIHTNTVENVFGVFKRGMRGTYQHCAEKHLHRYLAEFDFRYNARSALGVEDEARTDKALKGIVGKRLTYRRSNRPGRSTVDA